MTVMFFLEELRKDARTALFSGPLTVTQVGTPPTYVA